MPLVKDVATWSAVDYPEGKVSRTETDQANGDPLDLMEGSVQCISSKHEL